jgi:hypothetical protein
MNREQTLAEAFDNIKPATFTETNFRKELHKELNEAEAELSGFKPKSYAGLMAAKRLENAIASFRECLFKVESLAELRRDDYGESLRLTVFAWQEELAAIREGNGPSEGLQ